jgi:hypothetical protein
VEDVAEKDHRPEAPGEAVFQRGEEVPRISLRLAEMGVGDDEDAPLDDLSRLRIRDHDGILAARDTSSRPAC